ncbi:MAG: hypothetical protein LIP03_16240 [Bacteroidales bacterium]|nr:hypothetical protein [Bacteroidales bacterium]
MKEEKDISKLIGKSDGMTVPEGYFASFATRMADSLEPNSLEESAHAVPRPQSFWHRVRPYVYLAAMFAGVWCMLKMFTIFTSNPTDGFSPSPVLAEALGNEIFVTDYLIDDLDQWDLMDEMMENGVEVRTLFSNFYETDPDQYQSL